MRRNKLQYLLGLKFEAIKKEGAVKEKCVVVFFFICTKNYQNFEKVRLVLNPVRGCLINQL